MKKIKLLYDVVRTMKNMAKIDGVITVDVRKDEASFGHNVGIDTRFLAWPAPSLVIALIGTK